MKTSITIILTAVCVSGLLLSAAAQPATGGTADQNGAAPPDQARVARRRSGPEQHQRAGHGRAATGRDADADRRRTRAP